MKKILYISIILLLNCFIVTLFPVYATETTVYLGGVEKNIETGEVKVYIPAGNATVMKVPLQGKQSQVRYIYADHLGSTSLVIDEQGNRTESYLYYPYGNPSTSLRINSQTDKLYTGQRLDFSSDLYFYNARYYNPSIGNFISADKAQGPNRYSYVRNNPIMRNDPTGNYDNDVGTGMARREFLMEYGYKYGISIDEEGKAFWSYEKLNETYSFLAVLPEKLLNGKKLILTDQIINNSNTLAGYGDNKIYLSDKLIFVRKAGDYKKTLLHEFIHGLVDNDKEKISEKKEDIDPKFFDKNGEVNYKKLFKWKDSLWNSETLKNFTVLSGWVYDVNNESWQLTKKTSIWDKLKDTESSISRYYNPHEDFASHAVEYFFDSTKYQKKYGEELANFFQKIFQEE